jgi:hypothetical protein
VCAHSQQGEISAKFGISFSRLNLQGGASPPARTCAQRDNPGGREQGKTGRRHVVRTVGLGWRVVSEGVLQPTAPAAALGHRAWCEEHPLARQPHRVRHARVVEEAALAPRHLPPHRISKTSSGLQRISKTSSGLHRISKTSSGLHRISKTSSGLHRISKTSSGLHRISKTSSGLQRGGLQVIVRRSMALLVLTVTHRKPEGRVCIPWPIPRRAG